MLRIVEDRIHVGSLAMTRGELDAVRPGHGLEAPEGAVSVTYQNGLQRWSDGRTQHGAAEPWPAADALLADDDLAADLETYRGEREDTSDPDNSALIRPLAFLERFTSAERTTIRAAAGSDDALADWLDMLRAAQEIDLESQRTIAGLQALVDAGLISAARKDEILTP